MSAHSGRRYGCYPVFQRSEGEPKGVMLSHRNILANIKQVMKILDVTDNDVIMANLPIFHSFGMTACLFSPILKVKVVCHMDPTDVTVNAQNIRQHKATMLFGTSSFFRLYVRNHKVTPEDMASLRLTIAGAEKLQSEISVSFQAAFNLYFIYEGYGRTELSPVATVNTPFDNPDSPLKDSNKPGTVGKAPGTSCVLPTRSPFNPCRWALRA